MYIPLNNMDSGKVSTEQANFSLTDYTILMTWNKKIHVGGIFYDLAKTYDYVSHDVWVEKLKHYGIQEST
jgi:hypothetical protein